MKDQVQDPDGERPATTASAKANVPIVGSSASAALETRQSSAMPARRGEGVEPHADQVVAVLGGQTAAQVLPLGEVLELGVTANRPRDLERRGTQQTGARTAAGPVMGTITLVPRRQSSPTAACGGYTMWLPRKLRAPTAVSDSRNDEPE